MDSFIQNVKYGLRSLAKSPGFTIVAILTLALGIGANTAIFSVVNTVLLQPLSYPDPDRIVSLQLTSEEGNGNITSITKFNTYRDQTQAFDGVTAYDFQGPGINLIGGDRPEQLKGDPRLGGLLSRFRRPHRARPLVHARRRPARRPESRRHHQWFVAQPLRRRPEHHRPLVESWRRCVHRNRRPRLEFLERSAHRHSDSAEARSEQRRSGPLPSRRRADEARRHARASQSRDERGRRGIPPEVSRIRPSSARRTDLPRFRSAIR